MYNFHKTSRSSTDIIFQNENFQKGRSELLSQVKRHSNQYLKIKKGSGRKIKGLGSGAIKYNAAPNLKR